MQHFFRAIHSRLSNGERVFAALVVENSPHSPGTAGARMAVFQSGESIGTIGGGSMEQRVLDLSRQALSGSEFRPRLKKLVHRADAGEAASGLVCAGQQTNLYLVLSPTQDQTQVRRAAEAYEAGTAGHLFISPEGLRFIDARVQMGEHQRILKTHAEAWTFFEQALNLSRLAIFGGGHCGLALCQVLAGIGYHVTIVDNREGLHTMATNDAAYRKLTIEDMSEAASHIDHPGITSVVCMGTSIDMDVAALAGALQLPFPFVGVMGSAAKIKIIKTALVQRGLEPAAFARLCAPVGLPIGSQTPQEIAISVAAQILKIRPGTRG